MFGIKLPGWVWGLAGFLLILAGTNFHFFLKGKKVVQKDWSASIERGKILLEQIKAKQAIITVVTEIKYVERVKVIREKGDTIIEQVLVYVPAGSPEFGGGFRVLHDAASSNTLPDPSSIPNAAPVSAQTVATTVVENYTGCYTNRVTLVALQDWVRDQAAVVSSP